MAGPQISHCHVNSSQEDYRREMLTALKRAPPGVPVIIIRYSIFLAMLSISYRLNLRGFARSRASIEKIDAPGEAAAKQKEAQTKKAEEAKARRRQNFLQE